MEKFLASSPLLELIITLVHLSNYYCFYIMVCASVMFSLGYNLCFAGEEEDVGYPEYLIADTYLSQIVDDHIPLFSSQGWS